MLVELIPKESEKIAQSPVLQQTAYWAKMKSQLGLDVNALDIKIRNGNGAVIKNWEDYSGIDTKIEPDKTDDLLIINQRVSKEHSVAYVPYGPKFLPDPDQRGKWLEELSETIRPYLPENSLAIRYDLVWDSPWIDDDNRYTEDGTWMGEPDARVCEMRMNFDTVNWSLRKAPTNILPTTTIFIDLKMDEETILARMKPKTRYNIRLSMRKGVSVREIGVADLGLWYELYLETVNRNGITRDEIDYFKTILNTHTNNTYSPAKVRLLLAEAEGIPLAGMFLVTSGNRATYLYGASSNKKRNYMAPHALQWEAIKLAKRAGCSEYDLFGISQIPEPSHPMYGLYRFKSGFGGSKIFREGCWDYPYDEEKYETLRAAELHAPGYHQ